jgi:hypothetical protein
VYDAISPDDVAVGMHTGSDGSVHFNVLKFWDKMKGRLPLHATLAFRVYAALPTEANFERVFSMAARTVTKLRHKLGPKNQTETQAQTKDPPSTGNRRLPSQKE